MYDLSVGKVSDGMYIILRDYTNTMLHTYIEAERCFHSLLHRLDLMLFHPPFHPSHASSISQSHPSQNSVFSFLLEIIQIYIDGKKTDTFLSTRNKEEDLLQNLPSDKTLREPHYPRDITLFPH